MALVAPGLRWWSALSTTEMRKAMGSGGEEKKPVDGVVSREKISAVRVGPLGRMWA